MPMVILPVGSHTISPPASGLFSARSCSFSRLIRRASFRTQSVASANQLKKNTTRMTAERVAGGSL